MDDSTSSICDSINNASDYSSAPAGICAAALTGMDARLPANTSVTNKVPAIRKKSISIQPPFPIRNYNSKGTAPPSHCNPRYCCPV